MSESLETVPQEESNLQTVDEPHPTGNDEGNNLIFKAGK